ncbi:MAG: peptidase domain-containing ABC transporter [Bacteroidales bacterium]|jgi:ATP-binding cassette subfamily B protein
MAFIPFTRQLDAKDCGPACLRMVAGFHGKKFSIQYLRDRCFITKGGVSLLGISDAAESIGLKTLGARLTWEQLSREAPVPCIVHWNQNHFVVVVKTGKNHVKVADPALGMVTYSVREFKKNWLSGTSEGNEIGLCLLLEPTPEFFHQEGDIHKRSSFRFLFSYFHPHRRFYLQLVLGMLVGSMILLILPFLTQAVVDIGINNQDIGFIYLVLLAQLMLIAGRTSIEFIRSWILLHMSTRINISLISDYLIKLMRLPSRFFDSKMTGDILQRIGDHSRIESFLTQSTLGIVFSIFNLFIFSAVLAIFNLKILSIFLFGSLLYVGWIILFLRKRRELDQRRFIQLSDNQNSIIQMVSGMQEIKLNNCERQKRWEWEAIQAKIFRIRVRSLSLLQYQQVGSVVINESKNVIIAFLAAKAVIDGQMTLGAMFAVQFIIGQMNGPIDQLVGFFHSTQDAKISLERLSEVHDYPVENSGKQNLISNLPENLSFTVDHLIFQYEGPNSPKVLNDISLNIPQDKTTAIVGASGSGKTTLIKLLLGFYPPVTGEIRLGEVALDMIDSRVYRSHCGVVMQDGYIFSDTIARNIALGDETIDTAKLSEAADLANVTEFIRSFPLGFNTRVGSEGSGLSQGQKQRLLIARAIYKDPRIIFFDEATNSLDANNERFILENLATFFKGRTVVVVAHRLSTVRNADQIIVLDQGKVIEQGTHDQLIRLAGAYYNLVKNQLELGT